MVGTSGGERRRGGEHGTMVKTGALDRKAEKEGVDESGLPRFDRWRVAWQRWMAAPSVA
jgi:hypothetical protein